MAKVFGFEGFSASKAFGSRQGGEKILLVKGVATKAEAKLIAEKNMPSLRVFAGSTFANEAKAVEWAQCSVDLEKRANAQRAAEGRAVEENRLSWSIVDAGMQRGIANLLGL